jgi:hypothetical protein
MTLLILNSSKRKVLTKALNYNLIQKQNYNDQLCLLLNIISIIHYL